MNQQPSSSTSSPPAPSLLPHRSGRTLVTIAVVYLALLVLTGALLILRHTFVGPDDSVRSYFSALSRRDGVSALRQLSAGQTDLLLDPTLLASADFHPPTLTSVDDVDISGDHATAATTFTIDGQTYHHSFSLTRVAARPDRFVRFWHISDSSAQLSFDWPNSSQVLIAGRTFPVEDTFASAAFLGGYRVGLPAGPLLESPTVLLKVTGDSEPVPSPPVSIKDDARETINRELRKIVRDCAKSKSLAPDHCPFALSDPGDGVSDVKWAIEKIPEYSFELGRDSVYITTETPGSARVRYDYESPYATESTSTSGTADIYLSAVATPSGNEIRVEPTYE